jgi:hypothetical protein
VTGDWSVERRSGPAILRIAAREDVVIAAAAAGIATGG